MCQYKRSFLLLGQAVDGLEQVARVFPLLQFYTGMLEICNVIDGLVVIFLKQLAEQAGSFLPVFCPQVVQRLIYGDPVDPR